MTFLLKSLLFLLGMGISLHVLAAFYRIIDLWYTIHSMYWKVIWGIVLWVGISAATTFVLGEHWRGAFLWGMGFYVIFYLTNFLIIQTLVKHWCHPRAVSE